MVRAKGALPFGSRKMHGGSFLAENDADKQIIGHVIVRLEKDDSNQVIGLFSTFFVLPEFRRLSVASELLAAGERWMIGHGMAISATDTAHSYDKLINFCSKYGYKKIYENTEMIRLAKTLNPI